MKKVERTAPLSRSAAPTMPKARAITSVGSSMIGKRTSTPKRSRIIRSQAKWAKRLSTESAIRSQPLSAKAAA